MNTRRKMLAGLGGAALLAGWAASRTGGELVVVNPEPAPGAVPFPNVTLYTHEGRKVRFYDDLIRGKVVTFNMMYTQCTGKCPTMTANLRQLQQLLGDRVGRSVFMHSITLQPLLDTPEVLKAYVEQYHIGQGWQFLTGDPEDIEAVRFSLGFYDIDPEVDRNLTSHTGLVRMGNDHYQRWTMAPALTGSQHILSTLNHVDREWGVAS
ncbi:SCO family protein [Pseudomonas sp. TCU-HL1]|uniref:SCO family protein n=1 Tax=Pseudomonas sp. TCU-HL1 TaxID=1856685 RepID=UPI00083CE5C4|nr:SCO family protein [Pseudomonas sp. TCU-HL1]AOE85044.1 electron transporter SenC [Pseudomonas sp. TCU-HL1]